MKSNLDALMKSRNMDAIIVFGHAEHNPPMYYLTGGGHVSHATLIKKQGEEPVFFHYDMERDEAAKSGLKTVSFSKFPMEPLLKKENGNVLRAQAAQTKLLFEETGVTKGRVGVYGVYDLGGVFGLLTELKTIMPEIELVGEPFGDSIFVRAMESKDESEIDRIRRMGALTTTVVGKVRDYLMSCDVNGDETLLKEDGSFLTVGDVHGLIRLWTSELGGEFPSGFIFAIGRDAGVPHSMGNPADLMKLGQTIVFDIYPAERGGGYYYDFTRTWSLGYATPEAQKLYDEVLDVYNKVVENIDMNSEFKQYQKFVCDEFGKNGHKTLLNTTENFTDGYVHSLGHGLGLNIHERPSSRYAETNTDRLKPGDAFTIEPGLYYPEKGMGFRIEDSYCMKADGAVEILAEFPYDFVLPMKKWKKSA